MKKPLTGVPADLLATDPEPAAEQPPPPPQIEVYTGPWLPMKEAPMDGRTIWLAKDRKDERGFAAAYRRTRYYNRDERRWLVTTGWVGAFGHKLIDFEPQGWMDLPMGWAG